MLCCVGIGRNDSSGHCAQCSTYVIMEHFLKVIVNLEVMDCRETGGVITNMERDVLICLLKVLQLQLSISEITTDASATIIKEVRELKGNILLCVTLFIILTFGTSLKLCRKYQAMD